MKLSSISKFINILTIMTIIAILISIISFWSLYSIKKRINRIVKIEFSQVTIANEIMRNMFYLNRAEKNLIIEQNIKEMEKYIKSITNHNAQIINLTNRLYEIESLNNKKLLDIFKLKWKKFIEMQDEIKKYAIINNTDKAFPISRGKSTELFAELEDIINDIIFSHKAFMNKDKISANKEYNTVFAFLVFVNVIIISSIFLFMIFFRHLKDLNISLEQKVINRTSELSKTNCDLKDANQKLISLNKFKDDFLAVIAHDISQPLNVLVEVSNLLLSNNSGNMNQKQTELVNILLQKSSKINELIDNLLNIAKIEAGEIILNIGSYNLENMINELYQGYKLLAANKNIDISIHSKNICDVYCDKSLIERVLNNLISNAIKFTPPQGKIKILIEEDPANIFIKVIDTGQGVPESDKAEIFTKFKRIQSNSLSKKSGSGLGLYICHEIINAHKGGIWIESNYNNGAEFVFSLPKQL
ncbi:MAG TPA: HAMP domain-containing sensor histidine kinase [bacterium]|nr:HAMP domain-containing sensor histidine kinase [bacterium]